MRQLKISPSVTARTQTVENYLRDLGKLEMMKFFIDTGVFYQNGQLGCKNSPLPRYI